MHSPFSYSMGLVVQQQDLANWKTKLNDKAYKKFVEFCEIENSEIYQDCPRAGYDVPRGNDLTQFVLDL